MTLNELLKQSGIKFTRKDSSRIGLQLMTIAREKKVRWTKKQEMIEVSDFPDEFIPTMTETLINHFKNKNNVNKQTRL